MDLLDFKQRALDKVDNQAASAIQKARKLLEVFEVCFKNYGVPLSPTDPQVSAESPDYHLADGTLFAVVQETANPSSKVVGYLPQGTTVLIAEEVGVKARLVRPLVGWCNLRTREGFVILGVARREPHKFEFPPNSPHTQLGEAILKNDPAEFRRVFDSAVLTAAARPASARRAGGTSGDGGGGSAIGQDTEPRVAGADARARAPSLPSFSLNARDAAGMTLVHYASIHGRLEPLRLLLEHRADPNIRMRTDDLLSRGKAVESVFQQERRDGNFDAALDGLVELIAHRKKEQGEMALHLAVHFNHPAAARLLLDFHAQLPAQCNGNATALSIAVQLGHQPVVDLLTHAAGQEKALFRATVLESTPEVQQLLTAKVCVNCREADGDTPLHVAAGKGHEELVRLLVHAKADLEAADAAGHLPEDDAKEEDHAAVYALLRDLRGAGSGLAAFETELDRLHSHVTGQHRALRTRVQRQERRLSDLQRMRSESDGASRHFNTAVERLQFGDAGHMGDKTKDVLHVQIE